MRASFLILVTLALAGCSKTTRPSAQDAAGLRVAFDHYTTSKNGYVEITATVTNTSANQDFFAKVGDLMDGAPEHSTIFAAPGADAVIERHVDGFRWEDADMALLYKGTRVVVLKAGKTYRLWGGLRPGDLSGDYRIRVDYVALPGDPSVKPSHAYSDWFMVR